MAATITASTSGTATRVHIAYGDRTVDVLVRRDETVARDADPELTVVGQVPGAVILTDRYRSLPGGLSFCQAGEESFLRVIQVAGERAQETLTEKLASCRENLELSDPGVEWDPSSRTLRIHWLSGRTGAAEDRTYRLDEKGAPVQLR